MLLGVVGHGDALVTRQRADEDVRVLLLHQAPGLLDRLVRRVVRAADADELDVGVADLGPVETVRRLGSGGLAPGELDERGVRARDVRLVERAERAFAVRQVGELDRLVAARGTRWGVAAAGRIVVVAATSDRDDAQRQRGNAQRQPFTYPQNLSPLDAHHLTVVAAGPPSGPAVLVVGGAPPPCLRRRRRSSPDSQAPTRPPGETR